MNAQIFTIAAGAGLAAALLFGVSAKGTFAAMLLAYFAPLPIMIVALCWRHVAGLLACLIGALAVALALSATLGLYFALFVAFPAWLLAYLALLARPAPIGDRDSLDGLAWYPIGRIVSVAALVSAALSGVIVAYVAQRFDGFDAAIAALAPSLERQFSGILAGADSGGGQGLRLMAASALYAMPAAMAGSLTTMLLANLGAAGFVARVSGRSPRPRLFWIQAIALPRGALGLLLAALTACMFSDGVAWAIASGFAAALMLGFALQGLSFLHWRLRAHPLRGIALGCIYALAALFSLWTLLLLALTGVADAAFGWRAAPATRDAP